jgi:hypothetical protein
MKIQKKISQNRRDFQAIYECEHCGFRETSSGYDDTYFHNEVIPNMICPKCNKKGIDFDNLVKTQPKYDDSITI